MKAKYIGSAILVFLFFGIATLPVRAQDAPVVAAAADLQFALTEIAEAFKKETGREAKLTFGSSGNFSHSTILWRLSPRKRTSQHLGRQPCHPRRRKEPGGHCPGTIPVTKTLNHYCADPGTSF